MKKVIRLTESDLVRIVKRVLNESISFYGVSITPSNDGKGRLIFKSKDRQESYKVIAKIFFKTYTISVKSIWKESNGDIKVKDNTGKVFPINNTNIIDLVKQFNQKKSTLTASSQGVDVNLVRV
jgi:hypothetical protein